MAGVHTEKCRRLYEGVLVVDAVALGAVLAAIAGGAGEGLGGQLWAGIVALAARPFHRRGGPQAGAGVDGPSQLAALQDAPGDPQLALALAEALVGRAAADGEFAQALAAWWDQARHLPAAADVTNLVSGGTQYGPVIQGRDFSGLAFTTAPPPRAPDPGP